eukprot:TRINITY_DN15846_c0_g1_i1.p1 TRINITY_DN15846_c0_g1~~TRINITY_DN15846_c0_g1_i1.p1  ORF type:complete len:380 (-),score=113.24 TRINITY_DN15846_c0_g1_i1:69-1208(-)
MVRLTLELLNQVPQSLNPAEQRQLQLRGCKIPQIENLGGTQDAYECIDFSDNDLIKLGNFPPLKRLKVLLLANNRISRIAEDCFTPLPNILSITLTGNKLEKLVDLEPLTKLKTLERLSLLDNPVTKVKHYRPYMINKCQKLLRILDFNRIKDKERKAAGLLFAGERGKKLLEEIAPPRSAQDQPERITQETTRVGPTPEVIERIKRAIAEAETIEEVTRLEKALKSGVLPEDMKEPESVVEQGPQPAPAPAPVVEAAPAPAPGPAPSPAQPTAEPASEKKAVDVEMEDAEKPEQIEAKKARAEVEEKNAPAEEKAETKAKETEDAPMNVDEEAEKTREDAKKKAAEESEKGEEKEEKKDAEKKDSTMDVDDSDDSDLE